MILSGIATHIYNERNEKILQIEMERERIRLGYAKADVVEDEELEPLDPDSELGEIVREVALLSGDSGAEGDDEEAYSQDTNSPIHHRVKTFSLNNM